MAGVSVSTGGSGGRRPLDSQVNMIPMIDLLVSMIAFLLVSAVWIQSGTLQAQQPHGASDPAPAADQLKIVIGRGELHVGLNEMDRQTLAAGPTQLQGLRRFLGEYHHVHPGERDVVIQPDSTVDYQAIMQVMDVVYDVWSAGAPPNTRLADSVRLQLM